MLDLRRVLGGDAYADQSAAELEKLKDALIGALAASRQLQKDANADRLITDLLRTGQAAANAANTHRGIALVLADAVHSLGALAQKHGASDEEIVAILDAAGPRSSPDET